MLFKLEQAIHPKSSIHYLLGRVTTLVASNSFQTIIAHGI
uniref:Uncharacterized protein n=1 Tax=Arundo donax TaxID=35708 RepID=A0A0A9DFV6_ARUDO